MKPSDCTFPDLCAIFATGGSKSTPSDLPGISIACGRSSNAGLGAPWCSGSRKNPRNSIRDSRKSSTSRTIIRVGVVAFQCAGSLDLRNFENKKSVGRLEKEFDFRSAGTLACAVFAKQKKNVD